MPQLIEVMHACWTNGEFVVPPAAVLPRGRAWGQCMRLQYQLTIDRRLINRFISSTTSIPLSHPYLPLQTSKSWVVASSITFSSVPGSVAVFPSACVLSLCLFSGFYSLVCYLLFVGSRFLVRMSPL